jgi:hypothetical protein
MEPEVPGTYTRVFQSRSPFLPSHRIAKKPESSTFCRPAIAGMVQQPASFFPTTALVRTCGLCNRPESDVFCNIRTMQLLDSGQVLLLCSV